MCGLIGWLGKEENSPAKRANQYITDQFEDQQGRGTRGFGLVEIDDKGVITVLRATEPIKMLLDLRFSTARHILLHHRTPTSSSNTLDQTHPIEVEHDELKYRWFIMHNGGIGNDDTLKEAHEKLGYVYLTAYKEKGTTYLAHRFNDTEAFAIDLARFLEKKQDVLESKGSYAFIAIATTKDSKVHKIYIGNNGHVGLNLADYGYGWAFASEEVAGQSVPKDEITVFAPKYKEGKLIEFTKEEKMIEMKYPKLDPVPSPYSNKMGYGTPMRGRAATNNEFWKSKNYEKIDGVWTKKKETGPTEDAGRDVQFTSFGHIVEFISKGPLGEVFRSARAKDHVALTEFDLNKFNTEIIAGTPVKAEDYYNDYIGQLYEWFDMADVIESALEPIELKGINDSPTTAQIISANQNAIGNRMKKIAEEYLPLFKLSAYCECVLALAYQYELNLETSREEAYNYQSGITPELEEKNDNAMKEINELWPDKKDETKLLPKVATGNQAPQQTDLDSDAAVMLQALGESASESSPQEIYANAETAGETIRTAAELAIIQQLSEVQKLAVEDGQPISIPFHFKTIEDELSKTRRRFETLAHIVKATKDKEEVDGFTNGFLNG